MNTAGLTTLLILLLPFSIINTKMAQVSDHLYFDQTEVTNAQWTIFENTLIEKKEDTEVYRKNNVWESEPFNVTYFPHSSYEDYPVVGVTRSGAVAYCEWRNSVGDLEGNYRLPTKNEFLRAIREGEQSVKWFKKKLKAEKKNYPVYHLRRDTNEPMMSRPVKSWLPNKFGVHHLVGNLAEMVVEKDIVVGGSYRDKDDQKWSSATQEYSGPADWIGFRCVCELEK